MKMRNGELIDYKPEVFSSILEERKLSKCKSNELPGINTEEVKTLLNVYIY